jgi:hypothetical protein
MLVKYPHLGDGGFYCSQWAHLWDQQRLSLEADRHQVELLAIWLQQHMPSIKGPRRSSYGLKHVVEDRFGEYVSNGEFIAAALIAGFKIQTVYDSPNCIVNVPVSYGRSL